MAKKNTIPIQAYVMSEENSELGKLNYQKLFDVIEYRAQNQFEFDDKTVGGRTKISAPLPEEEIRFIEQTFNEAVDPLDLVGSTHSTVVPPPPPRPQRPSGISAFSGIFDKVKSSSTEAKVGAFLVLGIMFLAMGMWNNHTARPERSPAVVNSRPESMQSPGDHSNSNAPRPGGALSQSLNLGPAMPSPTIRVPALRPPDPTPSEPSIDVERNLVQGDTPEPSLIKRRSKKKAHPATGENGYDDGYDPEADPEREPAGEEEDGYEGEDDNGDVAPTDPILGEEGSD